MSAAALRCACCWARCSPRSRSSLRRAPAPAQGPKAAKGDRGVFVSKGVGRQIFSGGGGVAYGVVFSGGSLVVTDYSATHDMKVDSPVVADRRTPTARARFVPAGGASRVAFRISGTLYRVTVTGSSTFNAAGVYGRLQVRGKGTLTVNGVRSRWNGPASNLGQGAEGRQEALPARGRAASRRPSPPPPPPDPPPPPRDTTTG